MKLSVKQMLLLGALGLLLVVGLFVGGSYISYSNKEVGLRNLITAKMTDNRSEYDNMWKKISQIAQVSQKDRESLSELFNGYASARNTGGKNQVMTWIKESVPNVDSKTYTNLQNIIASSRDSWTQRQKELIDYNREHDNLITMFPSSLFVGKRGKIEIKIVTSTKTETTFQTGKDDDVDMFADPKRR